jgi:D-alanyl-lipoteichoic acid acyltransferase DltB (MBOAT superfamily)
MDLSQIGVMIGIALLAMLLLPRQGRNWFLMLASVVGIYWLQPTINVRWLDFSLPSVTLVLTMLCWFITRPKSDNRWAMAREDWIAGGLVFAVIITLSLARYVDLPSALELTSRPPEIFGVILAIVLALGVCASLWRLLPNRMVTIALMGVIVLLVGIKTPPSALALASFLRGQAGQDIALANALDLNWLGFSYVAFRLIHTLRDRQTGILPALSLREYVTFVVFAPAYTAGPIDRAERFIDDLRALPQSSLLNADRLTHGFTRIAVGMFKKFAIADSLALFSLDTLNATQAVSTGALWVMLYGYALRLFFDFSGYSDIAIGIGILLGIKLPENFDRPYLKHNITAFWQAWHISLTNWVRFYIFSPLSRNLLRRDPKPSTEVIMLVCNLSTMGIIGLWHGVTVPFLIWGVWHGLGLWVHKLWTDRTRKWYMGLKNKPRTKQVWTIAGWFITFHFVVLGWVWFAMPDFDTAWRVFLGLFGLGR